MLPWESGTVDLNAGVIDPCLHKPSHGVPSVYYTPIGMHFKARRPPPEREPPPLRPCVRAARLLRR